MKKLLQLGLKWRCSSVLLLLLLLLSRFSHVRLCTTPYTAAHQALPSLELSRQEHWSELPFPPPMHESENEREVAQSCPTLRDPMDCSLPGSSVMGFSRQEYWSGAPLPSLLSNKKGWTIDTLNIRESQNDSAEWKKKTKLYAAWLHLHKILETANQFTVTESKSSVS